MENCFCKNCGMEYAWVNDKDSGKCWSCKKPLVATKRRPTKRAPDVAKAAAQKGVSRKNRSGKRAGVA